MLLVAVLLTVVASPVTAFELVTRSDWGAKEPLFRLISHAPERITIHHTAVRKKPGRTVAEKLRSLQEFSQSTAKLADGRTKKAWADVPYHFYIGVSGQIGEGREVGCVGDTNTNYDPTGHIAVVVEGNFEAEELNVAQRDALAELLVMMSVRYDIPTTKIGHHKMHASTLCPGTNLANELPAIIRSIGEWL